MILLLHRLGKWQHVKDTYEIGEGKLFSPGNLRATFDNPAYDKVFRKLLSLLEIFIFVWHWEFGMVELS